ncbi:MAG: ABC transporter permease [Eubacteriales bacterium]
MKCEFRGFRTIFTFTLKMLISSKGWRFITVLLAALFLLLPLILLPMAGQSSETEPEIYRGKIQTLYVADETEPLVDLSFLNAFDPNLQIKYASSYEDALLQVKNSDAAVLLCLAYNGIGYTADLLVPDSGSDALETDAALLSAFLEENFNRILMQKSKLQEEQLSVLLTPVTVCQTTADTAVEEEAAEEEDANVGNSMISELVRYLLPYLTVMILYFLVLFYGQSVAQSVLIEKTSKLMDTFLVAVKPSAMIFGKVFACVTGAIFQLLIWVFALVVGFCGGFVLLRSFHPEMADILEAVIDQTEILRSLFSPSGIVLAVLLMFSGFLLYCSLAAIGGSLAGKQEDLQSTNILFTMVLVISFLVVLFGGDMFTTGEISSAAWQNWIPFTAVLVTPSRVLMGEISMLEGVGALGVVLVFSAFLLFFAGKLYKMMALYKGNVPKPAQIVSMLKNK